MNGPLNKIDLVNWLLEKFRLKVGDVITGIDLWNNLIELKAYPELNRFLGLHHKFWFNIEDAIIDKDPFIQGLFGCEITAKHANGMGLEEFKVSLLKKYRISKCNIGLYTNKNEFTVWGNDKNKDGNWGKNVTMLFNYTL